MKKRHKIKKPSEHRELILECYVFPQSRTLKSFFLAMTRPKSSQKATNGQDHLLSFNDMACHYIRAKFINPYERK